MSKLPNIVLKPIGWLKPYEKNAKLHPEEQIERLAKTIDRFGWDQPIVAWKDGTIIKGHGRRLAALKLGLTEVPVWVRADMTRDEADAARIADNAVFSMQYDTATMQAELNRLMSEMPDFEATDLGLTEKERKLLMEVIDAPNMDAIMADTQSEIEHQKSEDDQRVEAADREEVALSKAFGFSKIRKSDERVLTSFMAEAEEVTGKVGYDAFVDGLRLAVKAGLGR